MASCYNLRFIYVAMLADGLELKWKGERDMKRFIAATLSSLMIFAMAGCSGGSDSSGGDDTATTTTNDAAPSDGDPPISVYPVLSVHSDHPSAGGRIV